MKAITQDHYGSEERLQLKDIEKPEIGPDEDLLELKALVEAGKITPVIDGTYPLRETPKAVGHVAAGHARGTVVISMSQRAGSTA